MKSQNIAIIVAVVFILLGGFLYVRSTNTGKKPVTQNTQPTAAEPSGESRSKTYTLAEVQQHANAEDCWTAIDGSVYDLTSFVGNHPGGPEILKICGKDGTEIFNNQHGGGQQQADILKKLKIGILTN